MSAWSRIVLLVSAISSSGCLSSSLIEGVNTKDYTDYYITTYEKAFLGNGSLVFNFTASRNGDRVPGERRMSALYDLDPVLCLPTNGPHSILFDYRKPGSNSMVVPVEMVRVSIPPHHEIAEGYAHYVPTISGPRIVVANAPDRARDRPPPVTTYCRTQFLYVGRGAHPSAKPPFVALSPPSVREAYTNGSGALIFLPVTLAVDVVTMPIQVIGGIVSYYIFVRPWER